MDTSDGRDHARALTPTPDCGPSPRVFPDSGPTPAVTSHSRQASNDTREDDGLTPIEETILEEEEVSLCSDTLPVGLPY